MVIATSVVFISDKYSTNRKSFANLLSNFMNAMLSGINEFKNHLLSVVAIISKAINLVINSIFSGV